MSPVLLWPTRSRSTVITVPIVANPPPLTASFGRRIGSTPGPVVWTLPTEYPESTTVVGSEAAPKGGVRLTHSSCGPVYRYPTRSILLDTCQSVVRNVSIPASGCTQRYIPL